MPSDPLELEPFGDQPWPRGSGEVEAGYDLPQQQQTFAPVTIVQGPPEDSEEPFFPEDGVVAPYRSQGYEGSGAGRRFVTVADTLNGSAYTYEEE